MHPRCGNNGGDSKGCQITSNKNLDISFAPRGAGMLRLAECGQALIVLWCLASPPRMLDPPTAPMILSRPHSVTTRSTHFRPGWLCAMIRPAACLGLNLIMVSSPMANSLSMHRSHSTGLRTTPPSSVMATHRLVLSTGSSKRMSTVGDRTLPFSRSFNCQRVTTAVGSEQATS